MTGSLADVRSVKRAVIHLSVKVPKFETFSAETWVLPVYVWTTKVFSWVTVACWVFQFWANEKESRSTKYLYGYPKPSAWLFLVWVQTCTSHNPHLNEVFSPSQSSFPAEGFIPFDKNFLGSVNRRLVCSCSPVYSCSSPEGGWCSLLSRSRIPFLLPAINQKT